MTYSEIRKANAALNTLDDLARTIWGLRTPTTMLQYPFGGNNKRALSERQAGLVLRALYEDAALVLLELKVHA